VPLAERTARLLQLPLELPARRLVHGRAVSVEERVEERVDVTRSMVRRDKLAALDRGNIIEATLEPIARRRFRREPALPLAYSCLVVEPRRPTAGRQPFNAAALLSRHLILLHEGWVTPHTLSRGSGQR
jgi:hypothetical protein